MEKGLLDEEYNERNDVVERESLAKEVAEEIKKVVGIAAPMVVVVLSQFMLQVVSMMMVGHLGQLSLSSSALAISLATVSGFSFLMGMASGLETISGQAYGAQQFQKLGTQTYTAIFSLTLVCIPLTILWLNMETILNLLGQDSSISYEAGRFLTHLIPALFAYASLQPLVRYFQCQSLITPMLLSSVSSLLFHIPLCCFLVFKTELANLGAAIAMATCMWMNVAFLALYMKFSSSCDKTRATPFTLDVFRGVLEFFRFGIPSAIMICLEWWSFELLILLSGLLSDPELETSVLSICLTTTSTLYTIPYGVGAAGSTRVSNELGAGNPRGARVAVYGVMSIAILEGITVSSTLFALRNVYGYAFSSDDEVVSYVTEMAPFICISVIVDSLQGVISGVARGSGWQHIGAVVNLAAYYLFGIPIAGVLGFCLGLKGKGLWLGILSGAALQTLLLFVVTARVDWENEAREARRRIFQEETTTCCNEENGEERLSAIFFGSIYSSFSGLEEVQVPNNS